MDKKAKSMSELLKQASTEIERDPVPEVVRRAKRGSHQGSMKMLSVQVPEKLYAAFRKALERNNVSAAGFVRHALRLALKSEAAARAKNKRAITEDDGTD